MIGLGPALGQVPWHEKLRRTLVRNRGVRMGEAAVVSRQMHVGEPATPHIISVVTTVDAGKAFYHRTTPGEIIHVDVFHAVAEVDHRKVAANLRQALGDVLAPAGVDGARHLLDCFDLVTATGGGRVTGELNFGRKLSLRVGHQNHVHVAGLLPDDLLHLLLPLVTAVEEAVRVQGVELRRVEKVTHTRWASDGSPLDLSHYTDPESDTLLGGKGSQGEPGARVEQGEGTGGQSLRSGRTQAGAEEQAGTGAARAPGAPGAAEGGAGTGATRPGQAASPAEGPPSGWDALEEERRLQAALDLSRRLGSPDELKRVLDDLSRDQGWSSLYGSGSSQAPFIIRQLEDEGLVRREIRGLRLTEAGRQLTSYLDRHLRDVKLRFRKLIRRMPGSRGKKRSARTGPSTAPPSADVRSGPIRGTAPAEEGAWLGDLAVPETVRAAITRTRLEAFRQGVKGPVLGLRLERSDVHVHLRSAEQPLHICLLIDASASMAGRRILAAKHLARHLLVSTRDRVAVISFQERDVKVHVPFTRDYNQVEDGLARIQPMGLTPLAHGLTQSMDLIRASRVRRPLLLLITDGIPTVPKWTIDPLADALEAARHVGRGRVPFGCIGLQPSRRYLEELVRVAGGSLHVVEELDEEALVSIAHLERTRLAQKAR